VSVLDDLLVGVREDLAVRQSRTSLDDLKRAVDRRPPALDGAAVLRGPGVAVIAEVKRSSPSKGALAAIADPAGSPPTTRPAAPASSACSPSRAASAAASPTSTPSARRVDVPGAAQGLRRLQLPAVGGPAHGADLALLIVAALEQEALVSLVERTESLGMTPLVEVHDEDGARAGARRRRARRRRQRPRPQDPRGRPRRLRPPRPRIPDGVVKIAESGVRGPHDLLAYAACGADAVLVGEGVVTGGDPRAAVAELVTAGNHPSARGQDS
jgi:indole-3-glycerol phosphate synthase